jgi:hypothetical protein
MYATTDTSRLPENLGMILWPFFGAHGAPSLKKCDPELMTISIYSKNPTS